MEEQTEELRKPLIIITDHAFERAKERLSLNRKVFMKLSEKAFDKGLKHSEMKGNLKKYATAIWFKYKTGDNMRVYGENLFLFEKNILITVYQLPNNLKKYVSL